MDDLVLQDEYVEVIDINDGLVINKDTEGINYAGIINQILQCVNLVDLVGKVEANAKYVVQIPAEFQDDVNAGILKILENSKTGKKWPSLVKIVNGKHEIVTNLPIKEEKIYQNISPNDIAAQYQNILIQQQMAQLSDQLQDVYEGIRRIEQGQTDDRVGKLLGAKNQIMLASKIEDPETRKIELAVARGNALVAQGQILESIKSKAKNFEPISSSGFGRLIKQTTKFRNYFKSKDEEYNILQDYYEYYLHSCSLVAASYLIDNNPQLAEKVFNDSILAIMQVDFTNVQTIHNLHPGLKNGFEINPSSYLESDRKLLMQKVRKYDALFVEIDTKLLEERYEQL